MEAIAHCRPAALGGPVDQGLEGGAPAYSEHACQNRPGPTGHNAEATPWLAAPRARLLPGPSCLVTFALPAARRPVARSPQHRMYTLRCQPSAAALNALALGPPMPRRPARPGGGLPTWTRAMADHPHGHSLVPGGAVSPPGSPWLSPRSHAGLVPARARAKRVRGQVRAALPTAGLLAQGPSHVWHKAWVTPGQPAGPGPAGITSLAPYLRRMAITNNRLEKLEDGHVTCRFKASGSPVWQHRTRPVEACIRRFLPHVLPQGVLKGSYDGCLSPHGRQARDPRRTLLEARPSDDHAAESGPYQKHQAPQPTPEQPRHGRQCGGPLVLLRRLSPTTRGPPS